MPSFLGKLNSNSCVPFQYYYYSCECCKDVVDAIGVMGDCSQWGTPTENDTFCYNEIH